MTPDITQDEYNAIKRALLARSRREEADRRPDFAVRPISEAWRLSDRRPAYRTAVANVAYIYRDSEARDRFGTMPAKFADARCEVQLAGLALPASAPVWAATGYRIWEEADVAAVATDDWTAVAAWHVMAQIPQNLPRSCWVGLVHTLIERELTGRGAAVAYAVHALEGADGWICRPHIHLVVSALSWRHDHRHGRRHPAWISSSAAQRHLGGVWRRLCDAQLLLLGAGFTHRWS